MRYLGIDYGSKKIGIAISDEEGGFAFPHSVTENNPKTFEKIKKIAEENGVKDIVVGESKNYKGQPNPIMSAANDFAKSLEGAGFNVYLEPEFLSSHQAHHIQGKVEKLDASAAAIILQSYLDKNKIKENS